MRDVRQHHAPVSAGLRSLRHVRSRQPLAGRCMRDAIRAYLPPHDRADDAVTETEERVGNGFDERALKFLVCNDRCKRLQDLGIWNDAERLAFFAATRHVHPRRWLNEPRHRTELLAPPASSDGECEEQEVDGDKL